MPKIQIRRCLLIVLHVVIGINALGGGYYGLSGAPQVPIEWLQGSPFPNYFIPSLVLLFVVGGSQLLAALAQFLNRKQANLISVAAGILLLEWIAVQVAIIGFVSWLQPIMALAALATFLLLKFLTSENRRSLE